MAEVIIVNDSQFTVLTFKLLLKKLGHSMIASSKDGFTGISLYKELHPAVLTLDVTMPDIEGLECLIEVLEYDSNAKVIMLSGHEDKDACQNCLKQGAIGFLEKPIRHLDPIYCQKVEDLIQKAISS